MTKVQVRFHLQKPLDDSDYKSIAEARAIYGFHKIAVAPNLQDLMVEYDATRMRPAEVEAALARMGATIERQASKV